MVRQIVSILAGYVKFVVTSLALFKISGQEHLQVTTSFIILTSIYGAVFSFISGLVTQLIATTKSLVRNFAISLICR